MTDPFATPTFFDMKREARKLPFHELVRHAKVSMENRHECTECFTCACWAVIKERRSYDNRS